MGSHNVQLSHFSTGLFMRLYGDNVESNPIEDSVGYFFKGATMNNMVYYLDWCNNMVTIWIDAICWPHVSFSHGLVY
jgi:hypothetical protein